MGRCRREGFATSRVLHRIGGGLEFRRLGFAGSVEATRRLDGSSVLLQGAAAGDNSPGAAKTDNGHAAIAAVEAPGSIDHALWLDGQLHGQIVHDRIRAIIVRRKQISPSCPTG